MRPAPPRTISISVPRLVARKVRHAEDDDFVQAGMLYRVMTEDERRRLAANLAGSLAGVSRPEIVERAIGHFRAADAEYGARVEAALKELRG